VSGPGPVRALSAEAPCVPVWASVGDSIISTDPLLGELPGEGLGEVEIEVPSPGRRESALSQWPTIKLDRVSTRNDH
jgi:hypothetical protein